MLFNIGLELSIDRLASLAKLVFGLGTLQVVFTTLAVMAVAIPVAGVSIPQAFVLGGAFTMSTTAVAVQVMQERHEMGSLHGRATFAVLLMQVGFRDRNRV